MMIKYSESKKVTFERIERTLTSVVCDICGKEIKCSSDYDWEKKKYFEVMTGHNDWGNDSCESVEHKHVCPSCIGPFVSKYFNENSKSNTAYIEIVTDIVYPKKEYEDRKGQQTND